MARTYRVTIAQLNPTLGALAGNADKAHAAWLQGRAAGAGLVALPEMFITGYQTQDLVLKPAFVEDARAHIEALAARCADGPALAIGGPLYEAGRLYNAYYMLRDGAVAGIARKHHLPNYAVFDEERLYTSGPVSGPFGMDAVRLGTPVCEDSWYEDVAETMVESGAEILLVPNGSPYARNKLDRRMGHMVSRVIENGVPLIYLNMVGGQDDQVFDGGSFVLNPGGKLAMMLPVFDEAVAHVDFDETNHGWVAREGEKAVHPPVIEQEYRLMVEALRDYLHKAGFSKVVLGLSGGVDSALVATIATDAIGAENVRCVMLPSEYTSEHSLEDAEAVARKLGCRLDTVPIGPARAAVTESLAPIFNGMAPDVTEENIQSRLRGVMLMALSNKFGEMLLTTGNKSEVAVGYATIYGDMAGGYNPIKDLYKTRVFATCRWRNETHRDWMLGPKGAAMPDRVIDKPPSAELRADQKDEDSLPPYEVLDDILGMLIEGESSVADCVEAGFDRDTVKKIEQLIYISEYKRFQSAPGARLTSRAFWLDRRYPIVNRWRDNS
ncbi:NAD+ synthase [Rhodobacteraceae bacterium 2CG4]|uniref:Glutamine-dependent NAD(+) synthetase n=1 Tax=Halovulum marinum TaxID=2662447 RepID=A0A6L5YVI8_9RHOB|nr:NAD+ synthase [Halovulum marinum]MSU88080.1 NAD+ synthase [Halovulum marinum]